MGSGRGSRGLWLSPTHDHPRPTLMTSEAPPQTPEKTCIPTFKMSRRFFSGVLLAATLLVCAASVIAAAPGFWQSSTQADFLRGEVDQLSIDEHGRLTLGPELQRVHDGGVPFVWTLLPAPDGSVFLGTGNDGKVIRVDRAGKGTVFYDSSELEVHALASAPNGQLY